LAHPLVCFWLEQQLVDVNVSKTSWSALRKGFKLKFAVQTAAAPSSLPTSVEAWEGVTSWARSFNHASQMQ